MTVGPGQATGRDDRRVAVLERHEHGEVVIRVTGTLDIATTRDLDAELSVALAAGPCRTLVLDLGDVEVLDSTGLRALWTVRQALREIGAHLVLRRPSATVVRVLDAAGLTAMFDVG